jgi:signal transduction histidine kinase
VPIALGALSFYAIERSRASSTWVLHTREVLAEVDELMLAITRAESQQRGFLLTGDKAFFTRYGAAKSDMERELHDLRLLTSDNPVQRKYLRTLTALLRTRAEKLDLVLKLQTPRSAANPASLEGMRQGTELMRNIWDVSRAMRAEENRLLLERENTQRAVEGEVGASFVLGIIINVFLLYWAWRVIRQYGAERDKAEAAIRQINVELERRVEERTSELQSANESLVRSNEDLARFAYVASHDLQEPLRSIASYAGLLGRRYQGKLDEQADRYIRFMVDGAKRMQMLVQGLLAYSRAGTQALNLEPVDMDALLSDAKEDLRVALVESHATIHAEKLPNVIADRGKLTQVLENLIANAIKFSKPNNNPVVWIKASRTGNEWQFSVKDNGVGFELAYAEKVFVMFQRLHPVGTYPGAGIGLAVSKRIVEGHGGRIWAEAKTGEGATFFFTLPDKSPDAGGEKKASELHEPTSSNPCR